MNYADEYSEEYITAVNKTYSPMCSRKQVMPSIVAGIASKRDEILDFGAGKDAFGTIYLRDLGFNVVAHEIGINFVEGVHDSHALSRRYDIVFANNVINVQPSIAEVCNLLMDIRTLMNKGGKFVCNYPLNPRKCDMSVDFLESTLRLGFAGGIDRIEKKGYRTPVWVCVYDW
jgi:hypothetical protein